MKLNLDFSSYRDDTLLKNWWVKVKEHFTQVQNALNTHDTALSTEIDDRKKAVSAEADARNAADNVIGTRITNEENARQAADTVLQQNINGKADKSHTHKKADITDFPSTMTPTDGSVTTAKLADNSVTTAKLADNSVTSSKLANGAVIAAAIADNAVDYRHLKDAAVDNAKIAVKAVRTPEIDEGAVTMEKLAEDVQKTIDGKLDADFYSNTFSGIGEVTSKLNDTATPATVVIACENSGRSESYDYYCSSTSAQTAINQAISELPPSGGKIVLLDGTYNCSGSINVNKPNITIEGMGMGATTINYTGGTFSFIQVSQTKCAVKNLTVTRSSTTPNYAALYLNGSSCADCVVESVEVSNFAYGINVTQKSDTYHKISNVRTRNCQIGIHLNTNRCVIEGAYCIDSTERGINIEGSYNKISNNYILRDTGQSGDYTSLQHTIYINGGAVNNVVTDNYIPGKNYTNNGDSTNVFENNIWWADNNAASGQGAFVGGGENNTASGVWSFVGGGRNNTATGQRAFACGDYNIASGPEAFASGDNNNAKAYQAKFGHYSTDGTTGNNPTQGDAFFIGNGLSDESRSNAFRVDYAGKVYGKAAFNSTGADYAEFFEWLDGNPDNEDRRGLFVTLDGDKIRLANADNDYILGVISGAPGVVGNNHADTWQGMWMTDVFGKVLTHMVHHDDEYEEREIKTPRESVGEETDEPTIEYDITTERVLIREAYDADEPIVNPDYNPDEKYIPREDRPEWGIVGMMGQLVVIDDGTCKVNGSCKVADGGTATASESGYRVIARLDETHIKVLFK